MLRKKVPVLKYIVFIYNIAAVLGIVLFIAVTTWKICDTYAASEFLERVEAIPGHPKSLVLKVALLLILLTLSFIGREYFFGENKVVYYATLALDLGISLILVYLLGFNYNGIFLWVIANLVSHIKELKGKYAFIGISLICYIGTDHGVTAVSRKIYYVSDYIQFYDTTVQNMMYWIYNVMLSLNIILFLIFCVYIIIEQNGTITEVRRLLQQLSETNDKLHGANEKLQEYAAIKEKMGKTKERNRLAREIHDTLGHTLTGISAGVDACIAMIEMSPEATREQLEMISRVTRDGIKEVRRSVNELRPDALERLNLEHAIRKMVTETSSMTSTKIHFDCGVDALKFDEDEENIIYRVIQESITNSVRHGRAPNIYVNITRKYSDICISIKDDGIGCKEIKKGFGTRHIVERIKMLNGFVSFNGESGFITEVAIPIRWGGKYD